MNYISISNGIASAQATKPKPIPRNEIWLFVPRLCEGQSERALGVRIPERSITDAIDETYKLWKLATTQEVPDVFQWNGLEVEKSKIIPTIARFDLFRSGRSFRKAYESENENWRHQVNTCVYRGSVTKVKISKCCGYAGESIEVYPCSKFGDNCTLGIISSVQRERKCLQCELWE